MFNVGLHPSPRPGHRVPYYFPAYTKESLARQEPDSRYIAELASGKVFAVSDGKVVGYPDAPVGKWREDYKPNMAGGRKSTRRNMRRNMMGGSGPKFYVGLRRSPRANRKAPYWTPIYATSPGANATGLSCDVFENKAYRFDEEGEPIGYPDQPVGDCVDGWPSEEQEDASPRPKFYVGLRRSPRADRKAPYWTPIYATSPGANATGLSCDVFENKAYRFDEEGEPIGYPDQSVGDCVDGWPPQNGMGRRTNRRRSNRRRTNRRAGRR